MPSLPSLTRNHTRSNGGRPREGRLVRGVRPCDISGWVPSSTRCGVISSKPKSFDAGPSGQNSPEVAVEQPRVPDSDFLVRVIYQARHPVIVRCTPKKALLVQRLQHVADQQEEI